MKWKFSALLYTLGEERKKERKETRRKKRMYIYIYIVRGGGGMHRWFYRLPVARIILISRN